MEVMKCAVLEYGKVWVQFYQPVSCFICMLNFPRNLSRQLRRRRVDWPTRGQRRRQTDTVGTLPVNWIYGRKDQRAPIGKKRLFQKRTEFGRRFASAMAPRMLRYRWRKH